MPLTDNDENDVSHDEPLLVNMLRASYVGRAPHATTPKQETDFLTWLLALRLSKQRENRLRDDLHVAREMREHLKQKEEQVLKNQMERKRKREEIPPMDVASVLRDVAVKKEKIDALSRQAKELLAIGTPEAKREAMEYAMQASTLIAEIAGVATSVNSNLDASSAQVQEDERQLAEDESDAQGIEDAVAEAEINVRAIARVAWLVAQQRNALQYIGRVKGWPEGGYGTRDRLCGQEARRSGPTFGKK